MIIRVMMMRRMMRIIRIRCWRWRWWWWWWWCWPCTQHRMYSPTKDSFQVLGTYNEALPRLSILKYSRPYTPCVFTMTSSNGNIFRVTGHLCGEFTGYKGQWFGALIFSLICVWINGSKNNREAVDLRRFRAHYDAIVMLSAEIQVKHYFYSTFVARNLFWKLDMKIIFYYVSTLK